MDDLAGILTLLGLLVLSVPILLVVALVKIGNAKTRIDTLEREVQQLQRRLLGVEARAPDPTVAATTRATSAEATEPLRPQPAAAPPPPFRVAEAVPTRVLRPHAAGHRFGDDAGAAGQSKSCVPEHMSIEI